MKLKSVKILGDNFRSLESNEPYTFNHSFNDNRLSTKIFAGLNGSGKSNFLELLSEIFYLLEIYHFSSLDSEQKRSTGAGFEIEYFLPKTDSFLFEVFNDLIRESREKYISDTSQLSKLQPVDFENLYLDDLEERSIKEWKEYSNQYLHNGHVLVRIVKETKEPPLFYLKRQDIENGPTQQIKVSTYKLLPSKVIAYTSGQNELISNPFYRLKYRSFKELQTQGLNHFSNKHHSLFFLDYSTNFSVFVANMLLSKPEKLQYLNKVLKIIGLESFRLTLNTNLLQPQEQVLQTLQKFVLCSTSWIQKTVDDNNLLIIDYAVNQATTDAFRFHFGNSFNLFRAFYELDILNLHLAEETTREMLANAHKSFNYSDELPKPDPSRMVFRIEKIRINKIIDEEKNELKTIYYKSLSDGEHQFNEVLGSVLMMEEDGCLFLMDEPDTHFNPLWRAKFIKLLNHSAAIEYESRETYKVDTDGNWVYDADKKPIKENYNFPVKVRQQEIIITTHSPFVISDSQSEDVYKFERQGKKIRYEYLKNVETYGASIGVLLKIIFNREVSISDLANYDIELLRSEFMKLSTDDEKLKKIDETKAKLVNFGESIEKYDLYSFLREIEKEIRNKK